MRCRQCTAQFCWECGAYSMTTYPHYAGVPCNRSPTDVVPGELARLGLSHAAGLNLDSLERQYTSTLERLRNNYSQIFLKAVALESALVLRNTVRRLRSRNGTLPPDLTTLLEQLLRFHIAVTLTSVARKAKARRSLRTQFNLLIQRLGLHLSFEA